MDALIFDTTFLIDFKRERIRTRGNAHRFLERNRDAYAYLPIIAYGEFAEGFHPLSEPAFISTVESFEIVEIDRQLASIYAQVTRSAQQDSLLGRMICGSPPVRYR
ncbi:MAG: hypothetical protein AAGB06_01985 [Verrucomicrobiota bacterium]